MHYVTIIITLCLNCLIGQRVGSLHETLFNNQVSPDEIYVTVIRQYFYNFRKSYIDKHKPRHITILGASDEDLQQAKPLLENYPLLIFTGRNDSILYPDGLSPGNLVIVFLRNLTEETFNNNVDIISRCTEDKVLFVSRGRIHLREVRFLFALTAQMNLEFPEFAHFDENVVKLYSRYTANNCSMEVRLMIVWRPGENLNKINDWVFQPRNRNGCPVSVSTSSFEPKMILQTGENGSLSIIGGREGELVLAVAKKLNFTLVLRSPSVTERLKYSRKASIVNDVVSGIADIGIGRLRPTNDIDKEIITHSVMYDDECITWGVPRIMKWSNNVVSVEFTWKVWILIGLVFVFGCTSGYSFQKFYRAEDNQRNIEFLPIFLDVVAIHLGNPVVNMPAPAGGKLALIAFLCYATVLTTAYKTSLASILTTEKGKPTIVDAQGIINANLNVGGSQYDFNMLNDQVNDNQVNMKLVARFVVNNNDSETMQRLKCHQNFAFLARGSSLHDEKQKSVRDHESVRFDVFDSCVLAYHTVMVVRKASFLRKPINLVIRWLSESGILNHWDIDRIDTDKILNLQSAERFFEGRAGHKFETIFLLYLCCIVVCIFIFIVELLIVS